LARHAGGKGAARAAEGLIAREAKAVFKEAEEVTAKKAGKEAAEDAAGRAARHTAAEDVAAGRIAHDALHGDVSTAPNTATFWSGRSRNGPGPEDFVSAGPENALEIARKDGLTTLEGTIEERGLDMPEWDASNKAVQDSWSTISTRYAEGVSGDVHVVLGEQLRPGNIWENHEYGALQKNPNVTSITKIDLLTGTKSLLWRR
jgi:hypothetical protein